MGMVRFLVLGEISFWDNDLQFNMFNAKSVVFSQQVRCMPHRAHHDFTHIASGRASVQCG